MTEPGLSAGEHARLYGFMLDIAGAARGNAVADASGNHRFGGKGGLCVYSGGGYHDFSGGVREHGHSAFELIEHLYPNEDATQWARAWLACHPGSGAFVPGEGDEPADDHPEIEAMAFVERLYQGAQSIDDTPGYTYITQTRGLPLRPEDQAQLRWVANYRGDEGALLAPVTDDDGKLVRLLVTFVAVGGLKSPHVPARITIRGAKKPGLYRLGSPTTKAIETEGIEKGLAARAAGAEYVFVSGGVANLGKVPLPTLVRSVVIARDADPSGSPADQALWRGVVRRLGQGLKVSVTARPNDIAPKDAPPLKDLDDVWRYDPELVPVLLNGANLEPGRLGDAVDGAILDLVSRLDAIELGRARKSIAGLLMTGLGGLDDKIDEIIRTRVVTPEGSADEAKLLPWPDPVTDIGSVLNTAAGVLQKILAAPSAHLDAETLWAAHTHLLLRRELGIRHSPRLAIQSKLEDSGKTTAMTALLYIAARATATSSLTGASLFRETDANHWTVLWDEADMAFHKNTNPELIGVFNAGHDRKFALVHRQVPLPEGGYETRTFDTFTAIALTAIKAFPSRAMQSRCIVLVMQRASKDEAALLEEFHEGHEETLTECGRKFVRWAADINTLPTIGKVPGLINRIWLNWRPLLQIAQLAGGSWPARAKAAAEADMARVAGEKDDSVDYALLAALWRVFAADMSNPRRMLTADLITRLLDEDEGRWRVANRGQPIDEYYLRKELKGYVPPQDKGAEAKAPLRRWRPPGSTEKKWGYHELYFRDAFSRYLGRGLPSEEPPEAEEERDAPPKHSLSTPPETSSPSSPSRPRTVSRDITAAYSGPDGGLNGAAASGPVVGPLLVQTPHPQSGPPSGPSQAFELSAKLSVGLDGLDGLDTLGGVEKEKGKPAQFPRGPAGRKARKG
jgi:hypothetical protein